MRLPVPFVRLPLRVDAAALATEIDALESGAWRPHPESAPGNTAVPLVAVGGDPANDSTRGEMSPTPALASLPYTAGVLSALDTVVGRTRLMRIEEEGELTAHVDTNYYWRDHLRVHVPVVTAPGVEFVCGDVTTHMGAGEVWVFDTWRRHRVDNPASHPRVHLVVDTVGSASLWDLIDHPDREPRLVAVGEHREPFPTERVNAPVVMSPWELDATIRDLLGDVAATDPRVAEELREALVPVQRAWRARWARFGDGTEGWASFDALRRDGHDVVRRVAGDTELPNEVRAAQAFGQLVFGAALNPEPSLGRVPATPRSAPGGSGEGGADGSDVPVIDRPVFVVSSPRSGSTLLFETLARAPGVATIGGESHQLIESLPGLHPRARDWESNALRAADATPEVVAGLHAGFAAELRDRDAQRPRGAGPVRMLEKTPKNSLRVPFLATAFPDARFVYLYRDPRETISSMLDAWRSGRFVTYPDLPGWDGPPWSLLLVPRWRELSGRPLAEVVTAQWSTATERLLDDLATLEPDRWCVASYDRLVSAPATEIARICEFCDLEWDVELPDALPLARHTLDSPHPDKWKRNAAELESEWGRVREVAARAHDVFAAPPRVKPVRRVEAPPPATSPPPGTEPGFTSVHTVSFGELLQHLGASVLVTTYQSGRLIALRAVEGVLNTHFRAFRSPMGLAARGADLALGTATTIEHFQNQPAVCAQLEEPGHDACFMPRRTHTTGDIRIHDLAFAGDELWAVNTRFSTLVTFDDVYSFVPRWRPSFVTALAPEDRCHLNGLAVVDGQPRFVTVLGLTDEPGGWRDGKADGGAVLDLVTGDVVAGGLCMPHSPRWYDGRLWVLESGRGSLGVVDPAQGSVQEVARVPGFARGLAFAGPYAFVGLSQVREHVFEGLPLTAEGVERHCGVWMLDVRTGEVVAWLRFEGAVQEIYEVLVLPGIRKPEIVEPHDEMVAGAFVLPDEALRDVPASARS